ncbi:MAG: Uma2 family endonuclease, partial [Gemmatimonadaceae bacterium]
RYETVNGELLVTPAPRWWHQEVVDRLAYTLRAYLVLEPVGLQVRAPADVSWGMRDTMVQPDVFVVPLDEARTFDYRQIRHLLLAIEVLSPRTAGADRGVKRELYQRQGVPLYWIVDADEMSVEEWTPGAAVPRIERHELIWHPAGAVSPCTILLAGLFRPL